MIAEMAEPIPLNRRVAYLTVLTGLLAKGQQPFFEVTTLDERVARAITLIVSQNLEIAEDYSDEEMSDEESRN